MENITYRTNFQNTNTVEEIVEKDLSSIDFGDFDFGENFYYRVSPQDVARPDIISYKIYGTTNYWWFIMWYNGVGDVWNDLREMMVIKYPALVKIKEALRKYHKE